MHRNLEETTSKKLKPLLEPSEIPGDCLADLTYVYKYSNLWHRKFFDSFTIVEMANRKILFDSADFILNLFDGLVKARIGISAQ